MIKYTINTSIEEGCWTFPIKVSEKEFVKAITRMKSFSLPTYHRVDEDDRFRLETLQFISDNGSSIVFTKETVK